MRSLFLPVLLGLFLVVSCTSKPTETSLSPVNEYLVVGNDRGFRDDFINQANHVTVFDSSIRVRTLHNADTYFDYPIVNGYVHGGNDPHYHWRMEAIGRDTIGLTDTARNSTFYLHRLNRVDSLPAALPILTSGEISPREQFFDDRDNFVYTDVGQGAGCFHNRGYRGHRDWAAMTGVSRRDSLPPILYYAPQEADHTIWRLYNRFAQPLLVKSFNDGGLYVTMLDSVSANRDTLYGREINDRSFKVIRDWSVVRADSTRMQAPEVFTRLSAEAVTTSVMPEELDAYSRRRWDSKEWEHQFTTVRPEELDNLQLTFSNNGRFLLRSDERELLSREYQLHPSSPYVIATDDLCDGNFYWQYERHGDSLTLRVPLRIDLPTTPEERVMNLNGKEVVLPPSRWYTQGEWKATFLVGERSR